MSSGRALLVVLAVGLLVLAWWGWRQGGLELLQLNMSLC